jgi:hypothetical protein
MWNVHVLHVKEVHLLADQQTGKVPRRAGWRAELQGTEIVSSHVIINEYASETEY